MDKHGPEVHDMEYWRTHHSKAAEAMAGIWTSGTAMRELKPESTYAIKNRTSICISPYRITSLGFWNPRQETIDYAIPLLAMQMTLIHLLTSCLKFLLNPLGLPPIFSDMLAGLLLGDVHVGSYLTTFLKKLLWFHEKEIAKLREDTGSTSNYLQIIFPLRGAGPLGNFATIGFMIFQFLLGVKMDPKMAYNAGRKPAVIGILSILIPLLLGIGTVPLIGYFSLIKQETLRSNNRHLEHMLYYLAAGHSMTAFPVVATLLTELKILNSELGRLALSSSMVSEACNIIIAMLMIQYKIYDSKTWEQLKTSTKISQKQKPLFGIQEETIWLYAPISALIYVALVVYLIKPAVRWVIARTQKDTGVKETYRMFFIVALLVSGLISTAIGQHILWGPFILGLAIPDGPPLGTTLVSKLESLSVMLVPLFITISGLRSTLETVFNSNSSDFFVLPSLAFLITLGKVAATMLPCLYYKMPFREALALGVIMSAKGIVELSTYNIWRDSEVINDATFTTMIIVIGFHAAIVPYLVRALYDPAKKYAGYFGRTILQSKAGAELKVLACINNEENVPTFIKLLNVSNPTIESPVYVYMLHFMELVGRTAPMFISHDDKIIPDTSDFSESQHFVKAFRNFEKQNKRMVIVEAFTTISPFTTMHDDICTLALEKCTALVIMPFHKQWSEDGIMHADGQSHMIRDLNRRVLENAPCSVGILVDRGKRYAGTTMHVGMPFLGGKDDRESLAYAKRMSQSPNVSLTVIRFTLAKENDVNQWELMLDKEVVKDFKLHTMSNERVVYQEEVVKDGVETALKIRSLEKQTDLLLVGRQHEMQSPLLSGLTEWSEFPELGEVGDMLASSDVKAAVSVLVIQHMTVRT